jgi:hypothetical protein
MRKGRRSHESLWMAVEVDMAGKMMVPGPKLAEIEMPLNRTLATDGRLDSRID